MAFVVLRDTVLHAPADDGGSSGEGAGRALHTAAPPETPGPSVTPPADPRSETERAEAADATRPDPDLLAARGGGPEDALVAEQESAAAAEAAGIGGPGPHDAGGDPAIEPVNQAGGGVAEGFEAAEADLVDNAQHGDGGGNPLRDAPTPEAESDRRTAVDAAGNHLPSSEIVADPDEDVDGDPGAGPSLSAERS